MPPTTQTAPEGAAVNPPTPGEGTVDLQSPAGGDQRAAFAETKALLDQADAPPPEQAAQSNVPEGSLAPVDATALPTDMGLPEKPAYRVPVSQADAGGGFPLPGDTLPTTPAAPVAPAPPQPLADAATPEVQQSIEGLAEVGVVLAEIMTIKNPNLRQRLLSSIRSELQAFVDSIPRS